MVLRRVEPPAPYVTEIKLGLRGLSSRARTNSSSTSCTVFGGKNSNEKVGARKGNKSRIFMLSIPFQPQYTPSRLQNGRAHCLYNHPLPVIPSAPSVNDKKEGSYVFTQGS